MLRQPLELTIASMQIADWPAVRAIYLEGIATGEATFETATPDWPTWDKRHLRTCRLVARTRGVPAGWAALSPVSDRCAYTGVAEVSIYVGDRDRGQGIGKALLRRLIEASEQEGIWTLQAGVFVSNQASVAVHEACGFRQVGVRRRLGQLAGLWRDVLLLERRSEVVGAG